MRKPRYLRVNGRAALSFIALTFSPDAARDLSAGALAA
jgi:hypothetical protein